VRRTGSYIRDHHLALIALFVALGGTSVAAGNMLVPKNSVGTAQLKSGAVTKPKIAKKTIKALKGNRGLTGARGPTGSRGSSGSRGPTGVQGPKGNPGVAAARSVHRGSFSLTNVAPTKTVTLSSLAAGSYVIGAFATVGSVATGSNGSCTLTAGSATDKEYFWATPSSGEAVSWSLVTTLASPTNVVLSCVPTYLAPGDSLNFFTARIIAVPVTSAASQEVTS
jgi:hypothetical protein